MKKEMSFNKISDILDSFRGFVIETMDDPDSPAEYFHDEEGFVEACFEVFVEQQFSNELKNDRSIGVWTLKNFSNKEGQSWEEWGGSELIEVVMDENGDWVEV